jgi:hypothetical protein
MLVLIQVCIIYTYFSLIPTLVTHVVAPHDILNDLHRVPRQRSLSSPSGTALWPMYYVAIIHSTSNTNYLIKRYLLWSVWEGHLRQSCSRKNKHLRHDCSSKHTVVLLFIQTYVYECKMSELKMQLRKFVVCHLTSTSVY